MPFLGSSGSPCGGVLVGSVGVLRAVETPARLKAAPGGASRIGVPKLGPLENEPDDGELTEAGNPSSTAIAVSA